MKRRQIWISKKVRKRRLRRRETRYTRSTMSQRLDRYVDYIERLHVIRLLGISVVFATIIAFWVDLSDRMDERMARAWQLLTTKAPGNSGKVAAIEYLNSQTLLKDRQPLTGIDLSYSDDDAGVYLKNVSLPGADLSNAKMPRAMLDSANLAGTNLINAKLYRSTLSHANLDTANLLGTDLNGGALWDVSAKAAFFEQTRLNQAILLGANLSYARLWGTKLEGAVLQRAILFGADMPNAVLKDADLDGAIIIGTTNLTCEQLTTAKNWTAAFRGEELACGKPVPPLNKQQADLILLNLPPIDEVVKPKFQRWNGAVVNSELIDEMCEISRSLGTTKEHICDLDANRKFFQEVNAFNKQRKKDNKRQ